jgi:hypothetical protein
MLDSNKKIIIVTEDGQRVFPWTKNPLPMSYAELQKATENKPTKSQPHGDPES